jgi:NADH-quinone oxidoreductase subunit L
MLLAIIALPLLSAAVLAYFRNTWSKTVVSWVACSSVFASFLMVLKLFVEYLSTHEPIRMTTSFGPFQNFGFVADSLSLWWMLVVTGCGFLIHLYSTGYMHDDESFGRFMAKLNFFIYAMSLLVLADNFAGLLMGWANVGLASYMLIGFYIKKPSASAASMKAFVMNAVGEAGMIAGIAFIYKVFGTLSYAEVFEKVKAGEGAEWLTLIGILLLVGACAKSAQLPLHTWLPYAMEGPTPVSALIHAATMVTAGVYLVSRAWPIYEAAEGAALAVAWVGGLGALFGAAVAAGQNDIKRVLAFSTLSQVGYMFLGNGLGAYVAADFHFLTHAFFKAALFLTAGIVVHHYHGDQDIRKMGGAKEKDGFAFWMFLIGALALIGLPPFAGFFSKDEILLAAWEHNKVLFVIGLLAAGLTAFYNVRLLSLVFFGEPYVPKVQMIGKKKAHAHSHLHGHGDHHEHHATPLVMKLPVFILAVLSVVGGLIALPGWQLHFLEPAFEGLPLHHGGINWTVAGMAIAVGLIGMALSWYLYGPNGVRRAAELDLTAKGGVLLNMFYVDDLYDLLFIQPVKGLAEFVSDVADAKVVDGIVNGLASLAASIGSGLRVLQSGFIRRYALSVFTGAVLMLLYYVFYA